ncbi:D-lactate dehydrogenase [Paucidesulfovibrio gracilis DSM 16080]|uniref:D-lactate dehydrogenase (cytochrome) n=1 Tax=Paucidesulfovibrio gracilis DSM 16080 TaxID=1121449 RepID=A0A1T4X0D9_9BACT|nr:FAD-binding and (Fe-S)-binding domain-containing protein [Paucidesulfovibrio gracilis]SKA82555.1 D-lactate dehydrogenase [Paucidesulfovibrio gracilis DSM 16080]
MCPFDQFVSNLRNTFPEERVHTDELLVKAYSVDGSPFEPRAKAVVDVASPEDLQELLRLSREHKVSVTFRGAGTGVSGQTIAEEVTVRFVGPHWKRIDVLDNGDRVRAGCCVVGGDVNEALKPYGRFMTSDPSSVGSAFIGGMAATNAAGLSCVVARNIYHMMTDLHFTLMDGATVDTADPQSVAAFRKSHKAMLDELLGLRERILNNEEMDAKVRRKFSIRNTAGYSLNAFTDYDDPVEILQHLIIGSEGTLAFIHDITLRTAPLETLRSTALVGFDSLDTAIEGVLQLEANCPMYAVEFLNSVSLGCLMELEEFPEGLRGLGSDACALLLETTAVDEAQLTERVNKVTELLTPLKPALPVKFETDPAVCEHLWNLRRALFPILAGTRAPEEYAYSEDYCVPIKNLPQACNSFVEILNKHGFTKSGVHGHALHGNIHFSIPLQLNNPTEVGKVAMVIDEVADVVLSLGGALKAEHGTGRAVAPFVRREWGDDLYKVMQDLKKAIDPDGLLNPNVILNDNPNCHLENLKYAGPVDRAIDTCVDCGFCEYVCPSGEVGLSSRQRIYTLRAIAGLIQAGETEKAERWQKKFDEKGRDTCATDGLCSKRCPLGLDIAGYMRKLRHQAATERTHKVAGKICSNFAFAQRAASTMLNVASAAHKLMGHNLARGTGKLTKSMMGMQMPDLREVNLRGGSPLPLPGRALGRDKVVYFPSCAVRSMGYTNDESHHNRPLMEVTVRVLEKAKFDVVLPHKTNDLCCGKAFETKGLFEEADLKASELNKALLEATENGKYPVLCETSPCLARMKKTLDERLVLMEPVEFVLQYLADRLRFNQVPRKVALHATCSMREMGLVEKFREVAEKCVTDVVIPEKIFCCGFSGDKGFTHPELNASALKTLAHQIRDCSEGYSTSRTCEVGLTLHGKKPYRNILYLIDECTSGM